MRIGVLTTSYPRWPGDAAGSFVAGLNRYLLRAGHTVEVIAAGSLAAGARHQGEDADAAAAGDEDEDEDADADADEDGIAVARISSSLFYRGGAPDALARKKMTGVISSASFSLRMAALVAARRSSWDALIAHWVLPCAAIAAALSGSRPVLAIAHSSDIHLARRLGLAPFVRWLSRRAQLIYTAESLRIADAPGIVAPMGIEVADYVGDESERARCRRALGIAGPTLLFLGRLVPVKGVEALLAALPSVPGATLIIAGDGPEQPRLAARAQPLGARVRFVGPVAGAQKRALLLACDALVLPSRVLADGRTEGAPVVLMEALAAQLPIVVTDVGAARALVGDAGLVIPVDDPGALRQALERATGDDGWRARCRAAAAVRAQQHDWSQAAPKILRGFLAPATCPSTPACASA